MDKPADAPLNTAREGVHELADAAPREARRQARAVTKEELRKFWPRLIIANAFVVALIVIVGGWALTNLYLRQTATDSAVTTLRQQAEESKKSGDQANKELAQRGQPQVPIPQPGQAADTDVIVAAATARVLASLPNQTPSTTDLGRAVAQYVAANPIGPAQPTPGEISAALAGYFATSPPPSGAKGDEGQPGLNGQPGVAGPQGPEGPPGRPPTAEEIQAAVGQYIRDHPETLCPNGGEFAQIRVQLANGDAADTWQCVVATYPSASESPAPSDTPPALPLPTI